MDFYHQNTEFLPLNLGQKFFILLGLVTTAFSFPCWIIAKFMSIIPKSVGIINNNRLSK